MKNLFRNIFLVSCLLLTVGAVEAQAQALEKKPYSKHEVKPSETTEPTEAKVEKRVKKQKMATPKHLKPIVQVPGNRTNKPVGQTMKTKPIPIEKQLKDAKAKMDAADNAQEKNQYKIELEKLNAQKNNFNHSK